MVGIDLLSKQDGCNHTESGSRVIGMLTECQCPSHTNDSMQYLEPLQKMYSYREPWIIRELTVVSPLMFLTDPLPWQMPEEIQISWFVHRSVVQIGPRLVRFFDALQWIVACSVMFFLNWISFNGVIMYYITGQVLPILAPINRPGTANSGSHQQAQPWVRWVPQSTVFSPLSNIKGKGTAGRTRGNAAVLGWGRIWLPNHAAGVFNHVR